MNSYKDIDKKFPFSFKYSHVYQHIKKQFYKNVLHKCNCYENISLMDLFVKKAEIYFFSETNANNIQ